MWVEHLVLVQILICATSLESDFKIFNTTDVEEENSTVSDVPLFQNMTSTVSDVPLFQNMTDTSDTLITMGNPSTYIIDTEETSKIVNSSIVSQPPTTSMVPDVTTETIPSPTSFLKEENKQKECNCDFSVGECNINCCCDNDCSEYDKNVFTTCFPDTFHIHHTGLCYSSKFLYKNNTSYRVLKEEKGLLCIAQDNLPERLHYTNQKVLSTFSSFNKIWNRRKHFFWTPLQSNELYKFRNDNHYKYGEPIWKFNRPGSLSTIAVPISLYSSMCEDMRIIKYLENFESNCLIQTLPSRKSCENNIALNAANLTNTILIANPLLINISNLEAIPEDHLVITQTILCMRNSDCSETQRIPEPSYDYSSNLCRNIIQSVHYIIRHNGSLGIIDAHCIISLNNISLTGFFKQEYKVSFEWAKNESYIFERSGTPGYVDGKPLICGNLVKSKVSGKVEENVFISNEEKQWLSFPKASKNGLCDGRINVMFNHNMLSQCKIKLEMVNFTKSCEALHEQVWNVLFNGYKINNSNPQQLNILISSQGNPVPEVLKEWVSVFLEAPFEYDFMRPRCPTLISGLRYHILYSFYGPVARPQAKIIGVLAKTYTSNLLCANRDNCLFKISTSVTFTDVSQKAVSKFAKPPIIKIKLPSDVFYPFTATAMQQVYNFVVIISMLLLVC